MVDQVRFLTPPQIAKRIGVHPDKVVGWITSGELIGVNVAKSKKSRPRYRVDPANLQKFLESRQPTAAPKSRQRAATKKQPAGFVEYF